MAAVPVIRAPGCLYPLSSPASSRPFLLCSLRLSSSPPPLLSLRKRCPLTPFAASTSEWAQKQEEEKLDWVNGDSYGNSQIDVEEQGDVSGDGFAKESYHEPPEEAKLFVGGLPFDVDSEALAKLFDQAGVVEVAEVIYNRQTDQSRGFGFVSMRTVEEAEKAVEMFNGYDCNGRLLNVNKASQRGSRPERQPREYNPLPRIYVGNLPWQVDDGRLAQVFSEHGTVVSARVVYDRDSGRSRGFGFVAMSTQAELDDAIASLDGQTVDGRAIRVNIAEERPRQ